MAKVSPTTTSSYLPYTPHLSTIGLVSTVSQKKIIDIVLMFHIPKVFKGYPYGVGQMVNGMVTKGRCIIVFMEQLKAKLRFPLDPLIVEVLSLFRFSELRFIPMVGGF